jgi:hypothetical protein
LGFFTRVAAVHLRQTVTGLLLRAEIDRIAITPCPLAQRERKIAELEGEIDRLMRIEESLVVATGALRQPDACQRSFWVLRP